jgi:hypothetical protein
MFFIVSILVFCFFLFEQFFLESYRTKDNYSAEEKVDTQNNGSDLYVPPTKIPLISMNALPLLNAVLERVWVTKYFETPVEIYKVPSALPICDELPKFLNLQNSPKKTYLWKDTCLPLEIKWTVNKEDLSGVGTLRMLYFDGASEVLDEAFRIIKGNSLGAYKITPDKRDYVYEEMKKEFGNKDFKLPINFKDKFRTYSVLEGRYFLEKREGNGLDFTDEPEDFREYFSDRARKFSLTIGYDPANSVKYKNIVEYTLTAPAGFFGMERDFEKGQVK